jgi:hypothetical protein
MRLSLLTLAVALLGLAPLAEAQQTDARALFDHRGEDAAAEDAAAEDAAASVVGPTQTQLDAAAANARDWLYAAGDYSLARHAPAVEVTPANAHRLRPVCAFRPPPRMPRSRMVMGLSGG